MFDTCRDEQKQHALKLFLRAISLQLPVSISFKVSNFVTTGLSLRACVHTTQHTSKKQNFLEHRESNPGRQSDSLECYPYTMPDFMSVFDGVFCPKFGGKMLASLGFYEGRRRIMVGEYQGILVRFIFKIYPIAKPRSFDRTLVCGTQSFPSKHPGWFQGLQRKQ